MRGEGKRALLAAMRGESIAMSRGVTSKLALTGGLLGLAGIAALVALLVVQSEPDDGNWRLVVPVVLATPYCVAMGSAFAEQPRVRGTLLLAAALMSLVFTGALVSGAGIVTVPATVVLFIAAIRALVQAGWPAGWGTVRLVGAMAGSALVVGSLWALSSHEDPRCWQTVRYEDGSRVAQPSPCVDGIAAGSVGAQVSTERDAGTVVGLAGTSDVVTAREAGQTLALLSLGVLVVLGAGMIGGSRRPADRTVTG